MIGRRSEPAVAIGLGRYGHPVLRPSSAFRKSALIVGASRTGKTRLASSLANQQTVIHGGGQLVIDFKGDPALVAAKARLAEREGRPFLHFTFQEKGGGSYPHPHPYAPPTCARYDPLARGNGTSKTAMLLNSVSHDGDAAVYLNTARELTELCWNLAALTGYDQTTVAGGSTRISALEVLMNMLAVGTGQTGMLATQGAALNVDAICTAHPDWARQDVETQVRTLRVRAASAQQELTSKNSVLASAAANTRQLVSSYVNSSALYPGSFGTSRNPAGQIDLVRAILRGEIIVFSLNSQQYQDFAEMIGTMILLDLQNAVSVLRARKQEVAAYYGGGSAAADDTPWPPFIVQIEELGTAVTDASAEALINLLNKSADTGVRVIASTQALADIRKIDGNGVWLDQLLGQADHLMSLQLGAAADDEAVCSFSGTVTKQFATNEIDVSNNRFRLGTGASEAKKLRGAEQKEMRVPPGTLQQLDYSRRELVYITKAPKLTAVHTTAPEGPNNWYEVLEYVPVDEPDYPYDPFALPDEAIAAAQAAAIAQAHATNDDATAPGSLLSRILGATPETQPAPAGPATPPQTGGDVTAAQADAPRAPGPDAGGGEDDSWLDAAAADGSTSMQDVFDDDVWSNSDAAEAL